VWPGHSYFIVSAADAALLCSLTALFQLPCLSIIKILFHHFSTCHSRQIKLKAKMQGAIRKCPLRAPQLDINSKWKGFI
jgi:hypothetical protein